MFHLTVLCTGTLKESYLRDAVSEYQKRLSGYCAFRILEKKPAQFLPILAASHAYKIALCVEGALRSSEALASLLEALPTRGYSEAVFVIGDSDGLAEEVKAACDLRLSFSPMTFPHQLMRVILCEQLYRCMNINGGGKYHK